MNTGAFAEVSTQLMKLLQDGLDADSNVQPKPTVVLDDPRKPTSGGSAARVSLWLYQVGIDEFGRNNPSPLFPGTAAQPKPTRFAFPPLGVNLFYLITPVLGSNNPTADQTALARAMLTLHENAVLAVSNPSVGLSEQIRIGLASESLDDRVKLWESLSEPYRLSACYVVRTVRLMSPLIETVTPVASMTTGMDDVPARMVEA